MARSLPMKSRKRLARDVVSVVTGAGLVYDVTDTDSGSKMAAFIIFSFFFLNLNFYYFQKPIFNKQDQK